MRAIGATVAAVSMLAVANGSARADVALSGPTDNAGTYSTTGLSALATPGDTVSSAGLTGISVWGLLGGAASSSPTSPVYGGITTSTPAGDNGKNAILRYYLVGASASGAQSVVSLGEIDPSFGGTAAIPDFVAFESTGSGLLPAPELVVPGGAGRDLSNLTSLSLLAVPALPTGAGGPSANVALSGNVANPGAYGLTDLQTKFTPVNEVVSGDTYTGVPLWTFLDATGPSTNQMVVTQATDGYEVVLSLAELDPSLGGNPADLLPYADTGTDFPGSGVARTIFPLDNKHGRWESNLDAVEVLTVPEPPNLAVFGAALMALRFVRVRTKR